MSTEDNKMLVRRFMDEVFNEGNIAAIPNYMREGTLLAGNTENMVTRFKQSFPDLRYAIQDIVAEGDTVAIYTHWTGTNAGPNQAGPATGKQVASTAFWFFKIKEGRIVSEAAGVDRMDIWEQLGLMQRPGQPAG
jgi:predicted ester cyclase